MHVEHFKYPLASWKSQKSSSSLPQPWQNCNLENAIHTFIHTLWILLLYKHHRNFATEFLHNCEILSRKGDCIAGSCLGEETGSICEVILLLWWWSYDWLFRMHLFFFFEFNNFIIGGKDILMCNKRAHGTKKVENHYFELLLPVMPYCVKKNMPEYTH